jgi:hypothetical protein
MFCLCVGVMAFGRNKISCCEKTLLQESVLLLFTLLAVTNILRAHRYT